LSRTGLAASVCIAFLTAMSAGCANRGRGPAIRAATMDQDRQWQHCVLASPGLVSAMGAVTAAESAARPASNSPGTPPPSIERLQAIRMLRESLYRTCERYLSGAIDRASLAIQAERDFRALTAILAIEALDRIQP
jgi:hypothetical protein